MAERPIKITECFRVIQNLFAKPKYTELNVTMEAWLKLMTYCHLVGDNEITGLGRIQDKTIVDFKIPKQIVTGTTANATDEAMIELLREIPVEEIEEWELDWHSHVDMEAFISTTDEKNYELMSMARGNKQFPLLVVNKRGEICFKNFIHEGKAPDIKLTLLKEELPNDVMEGIYAKCKEDVLAKVSEQVYIAPPKPLGTINLLNKSKGKSFKKKEEENIVDAEYEVGGSHKKFCKWCQVELITPDEIESGLCEDCQTYGYERFGGYGW